MNVFYRFTVAIGLLTVSTSLLFAQSNLVITGPDSATPGASNTLIGLGTGQSLNYSKGQENVFVGGGAGGVSAGSKNVYVGFIAGLRSNGNENTYMGYWAGYSMNGDQNVAIGKYAGYGGGLFSNTELSKGSNNVYVGSSAGYNGYPTGVSRNVMVGDSAGFYNQAPNNVFLGGRAGVHNTLGVQNTFLGYQSGYNTTSSANTFLGYRTGYTNTTGQFNSFIGVQAGLNNTTGSSNYFFGTNAGVSNTTGSANYFLGDNAGGGNSSGSFNIYIGPNAGNGQGVNRDNNLAIGFEAGKSNISGVNNTFLGFRADAGDTFLSNATAIGNNAKVSVSNAVVLGEGANVGIGTSAPSAKLEVNSGSANTAGLKLSRLTSNFTPTTTASKFLTVDGSGNVVLATYTSGGREGTAEAFWQRSGDYLKSVQGNGVIIGSSVNKTPAGYKLFVEDGILTEKVKVAVKSTTDWSDKVFESDYPLKSLEEVHSYIQVHKHLPGVPSAQEMVQRGNDLHQTDAKLLEKIEELTLYSIQQQKEIDELKKLVKQLARKK